MKKNFKFEYSSETVKTGKKVTKKRTLKVSSSKFNSDSKLIEMFYSIIEFFTNPIIQEFVVMIITYIMNRSFYFLFNAIYYWFDNRFFVMNREA